MTAYVDRIRFASGNNPVTTIELRVGRGEKLLSDTVNPEVERSEDVNLPNIIAGKNASGKTSLLRGLVEIDRLLQRRTITTEASRLVKTELRKMGITSLEIQYSVHLGNNTPLRFGGGFAGPNYSGNFSVFKPFRLHRLPVRLTTTHVNSEGMSIPSMFVKEGVQSAIELEQLIQIKMEATDKSETLQWRDGLRLRCIGRGLPSTITEFFPEFAALEEDKSIGKFRKCKSSKSIKRFLGGLEDTEIYGETLDSHHIAHTPNEHFKFQRIALVTVDRQDSKEEVENIKENLPSIWNTLQKWTDNPEEFRELLLSRLEDNRLLALMGLKTSDLMDQRVEEGDWKLWEYAPDVIEHLMMWPEWVHLYTWFTNGTFSSKQAGLDFVMEGIVHDIVFFVTGVPNKRRKIIALPVDKNGKEIKELQWADSGEEPWRFEILRPSGTSVYPHFRPMENMELNPPRLTVVLRELPFLSEFLGMQQEDQAMLDILARFNRFSSTEAIQSGYLSSGQQQILSLIAAVRRMESGSLILIDEPEISLHMDWQEIVIAELQAPLDGSRLLVATHSPDIVVRHRHLCTTIETVEEGGFDRGST
jgi:ABC-type transport system involved in cytochrome c biogenesis ATPase subunit